MLTFLCEPCDISDQKAQVKRHHDDKKYSHPDAHPETQRQEV